MKETDETRPHRIVFGINLNNFGLLIAGSGIVWDQLAKRHGASPPGAHAVAAIGLAVIAAGNAFQARARGKSAMAINAPVFLYWAFATAAGENDRFHPPIWLAGMEIAILVLLVGVAIPFAIYVISQEQDERERKIIMSAMSIAFLVTLTVLITFNLLDDYTRVASPSSSWILVAAAVTWGASYLVLRERM